MTVFGIIWCLILAMAIFSKKHNNILLCLLLSCVFQGACIFSVKGMFVTCTLFTEIIYIATSIVKVIRHNLKLESAFGVGVLFAIYATSLMFISTLFVIPEATTGVTIQGLYKIASLGIHFVCALCIYNCRSLISIKELNKDLVITSLVVLFFGFYQYFFRAYYPWEFIINNKSYTMYKSSQFQATFTEPSYCGAFLSGLFWYVVFSKMKLKIPYLSILFIAIMLNMSSTGLIMFIAGLVIYFFKSSNKTKLLIIAGAGVAGVIALCFINTPIFAKLFDKVYNITFGKFSTHSYSERNAWNVKAINVFFQTYFLGAGLSSVRASSFLLNMLGTVGVIGLVLMGIYFYKIANKKYNISVNNNYLVYVLIGMLLSIPDLNFTILWLAIFVTIISKRKINIESLEEEYYEPSKTLIK